MLFYVCTSHHVTMPPILIHLSATLLLCWRYRGMGFCQWLAFLLLIVVHRWKRFQQYDWVLPFSLLPYPLKPRWLPQWLSLPPGLCQIKSTFLYCFVPKVICVLLRSSRVYLSLEKVSTMPILKHYTFF